MKKRVKILFTNLSYLNHNYGAQGIAFSLMELLDKYFKTEYTFALPSRHYEDNVEFSKKYKFNVIPSPNYLCILSKYNPFIRLAYYAFNFLKRRKFVSKKEQDALMQLLRAVKESDVIIDLTGIEFVGNIPLLLRYISFLSPFSLQYVAKKHNKLYLKYTKSYGPFPEKIYEMLVKKQLNKLPFIFIRGKDNFEQLKRLNLKVPMYNFPDISFSLSAEKKEWAAEYLRKLGLDLSKKFAGLSPSSVIAQMKNPGGEYSCAANHLALCRDIIKYFQSNNQPLILIPHSVGDGKDIRTCDLALTRKIYHELPDKSGVFLIDDKDLTYKQVRSIIGLLDFYITGRYHGVASALSMAVPVVCLSWHVKYKDIMSLFLDDFLTIDCRRIGVNEALTLVEKYYQNRQWFDKEKLIARKRGVLEKIDQSIDILASEINKLNLCRQGDGHLDLKFEGSGNFSQELLKLIKYRRSVRFYNGRKLNREDVLSVIEAGIWAPSGCNNQELRFLILDKDEDINEVVEFKPFFRGVSHMIFVFCDMSLPMSHKMYNQNKYEKHMPYVDAGLALSNMINFAKSKGIDTCIYNLSEYHFKRKVEKSLLKKILHLLKVKLGRHTSMKNNFEYYLRKKLNVPPHLKVLCGLALGHAQIYPDINKEMHGTRKVMREPLDYYLISKKS